MREACCGDVSVDMAMISNNSSSIGLPVDSAGTPAGYNGSVCEATLVICCPVLDFFLGDMGDGKMYYKWLLVDGRGVIESTRNKNFNLPKVSIPEAVWLYYTTPPLACTMYAKRSMLIDLGL